MPKYLVLSLLLFSCHVSSADNFEQLLQKNIASLSEKVFKSADNEQLLDDYNQKRMSFINFAEDNVFHVDLSAYLISQHQKYCTS